ncbi:AAA domain-containing protein [uncultured Fibrella sp.]|uniref:AAA domain-containing protein n=1 Tax=uncultured Fibrella sp. TaxID=1284596 RepID=UPI0035C99EC9
MHFSAAVLKTYRRRLTNLSSRNRSLLLSSLPVDQFVDLHDADFRLNKPSFDLVVGLMARKHHIALCAVTDPRDERTNTLSKRLRRLARTERFIEEERGTEDLYVGWPFVRGRFNDGTPVHGPLLFFPVHLTTEGNEWRLERRGDVPVQFNQSMGLAYSYFNGIKLPDEWLDPDFDGFDKDPLTFRMQLYDWLKSSPFELNFNTKNFTNLLQPFDKQSAKSLTQLEKAGELTLMPEAVLGIFPQAGSFLVPDYDQLLAEKERLEQAESDEGTGLDIGMAPPTLPVNAPLKEASLLLPLAVDASQEAAVRAVKAGLSVVVQGPPGTGKSQLIANLMADAAAQGKRVLLVCQKRAALDVVHQRLMQVGMAPFAALVHDFQDDRKPLYTQLAAQIDAIEAYQQQNNGLDAVLLEREFDVESRRIDALVAELQAFKDALFDLSICGVSVKELYLNSNPNLPGPNLTDLYRDFRLNTIGPFREQLGNYLAYKDRITPNHPFADRVSFATLTGQDLASLRDTITEAAQALPDLLDRAGTLFGQPLAWPDLTDQYAPQRTQLDTLAQTVTDPLVWAILTRTAAGSIPEQVVDTFKKDKADLQAIEARGLLQTADTNGLPDRLRQGIGARQSVFSWLFYTDKPYLAALVQAHGLNESSLANLQALDARWVNRQSWEARANETGQQFAGISVVGSTPAKTSEALQTLETAVSQAEHVWQTLRNQFPALLAFIATEPSGAAFGQRLMDVRFLLADVIARKTRWQTYLTASQLAALSKNPTAQADALQTALRLDADNLMEMDRSWETFTSSERKAAGRTPNVPAFDNALRLAWIDDIERQHPELRSVSSLKMGQNEAALQQSIRQKQALTHAILGLKLREQTYQALVVNRLNNLVSYRELRHQVTKKRSIWPIRKLMEHHADEVFRLVPCWMASPESVSTLFPMREGLFDLVIFDEASQCFAENGLPAMLRGQQVVVTGDSKQLRPSDLYRARFDLDEPNPDDEPDSTLSVMLEVESLLDLAAQYLPQVSLTGHYRSRSLDLIAFSNEHFYDNKLTLLPDFAEVNRPEPGIRYLNVKGQWLNNTNPIEAEAVLALTDQLRTELPGRSIGVVTFNFQQQQLIQELLENQLHLVGQTPESHPAAVRFVKNIENVQGDECDVIIFSVGYAPDAKGKVAAQFGSLNMSGGENRLNVAVTRARERTYVITSVYPDQLSVENTSNEGPKMLKAYLQYALNVAQGQFKPQPRAVVGIQSGGLLKNKLAATHPHWRPELPFADLTIREDKTYQGLILTDDDQYFQQTPKEAHAYRPFALTDRHWPFQRQWSREVWRQPGQS